MNCKRVSLFRPESIGNDYPYPHDVLFFHASWRIDNSDRKCGRFGFDGTLQSRQHEHVIGKFAYTRTAIGRLFEINIGSRYLPSIRIHSHQSPFLHSQLAVVQFSAYVKFRNASQDERLSIITRMNLLELIELRAKSWQISDGLNTYYKHKASDVQVMWTRHPINTTRMQILITLSLISQPETISSAMNDITLLGTSPPASTSLAQNLLAPGELIRTSGKFTKPTKIPGKNYSKDEVVIRNADSGKGKSPPDDFFHFTWISWCSMMTV